MNLAQSRIYTAIVQQTGHQMAHTVLQLTESGRDLNIRGDSGETFLHVLIDRATEKGWLAVPVVYQLCLAGLDVNAVDHSGSAGLHRVVRQEGAWRYLVALMRCGADPTLTDGDGKTAESILIDDKPDGWEEMLHWMNKFNPGLAAAVSDARVLPDPAYKTVVERLLRSWCRVPASLYTGYSDDVSCILRRYEKINELAIAVLAGSTSRAKRLLSKGLGDINTADHSYQHMFGSSPEVPQPLIAAAWEQDNLEIIELLMSYKPDTSLLYSNQYNREKKPLFFQMVAGVPRPTRTKVINAILKNSDLNQRNSRGQTILFEAFREHLPSTYLNSLLAYGVDVSSRDYKGRTARHFASLIGGDASIVDAFVLSLIIAKRQSELLTLILRDYPVMEVFQSQRKEIVQLNKRLEEDRTMKDMNGFLSTIPTIQKSMRRLLRAADQGDLLQLTNLAQDGVHRCQNKCGHTILHRAILAEEIDIAEHIIAEYSELCDVSDNMALTPLHYACALLEPDQPIIAMLRESCTNPDVVDVKGKTAMEYRRDCMSAHHHAEFCTDLRGFESRVFLREIDIERRLLNAIVSGNKRDVDKLIKQAAAHTDVTDFNNVLFNCIDNRQPEIASNLIENGCDPDIWKQYEMCDPKSADCSSKQCSHPLVSLQDRATALRYDTLTELIENKKLQKITRDANGNRMPTPYEEMARFHILC